MDESSLVTRLEDLAGWLSDTPISRIRSVDIATIHTALLDAATRLAELEKSDD